MVSIKNGETMEYLNKIAKKYHVTNISLYVHVENSVALSFYKKNGFIIDKILTNYYNNCIPYDKSADAYQMIKQV